MSRGMSEMRRVYKVFVVDGTPVLRRLAKGWFPADDYCDSPAEAWAAFGKKQEHRFKDLMAQGDQCRQWMGIAAQQIQQEQR